MLRILLCILLVLPCSAVLDANAQFTSGAQGRENQHLLRTQNVPNVRQHYAIAETTTVTRLENNQPPVEYQREVVYYFTQLAKESPKKGFTTIEVNIDSMLYRMKRGEEVWEYNSQDRGVAPTLTPDMEMLTAALNRPFTLTLSPYGEAVKIESKDIDWLKNYVVVEGRTVLDTVRKFVWLDGVSDAALYALGDVRHNLLPFTFVHSDSTWKRAVAFRTDGLTFQDTARVSFSSIDQERYMLHARADSLQPALEAVYSFGIDDDFAHVLSGSGTADMTLTVNHYGVVEKAHWVLQATTAMRRDTQAFTEKIRTVHSLTLIGQYRW